MITYYNRYYTKEGCQLVLHNEKSLERAGSVTGEVVLCSGLVDGDLITGLSQEIH